MWTYLSNSKRDVFPLEQIPNRQNLDVSIHAYIELIEEGFFTSFQYYDSLFISEYSPKEQPLDKKNLFKVALF